MFESLSDRLTGALQGLRGKGRLTDADIDATTREIRLALLEADVSLPVVRSFVTRIKDRAKGAEVSGDGSVRDALERDLYAILPAPAPAKPVSEAS